MPVIGFLHILSPENVPHFVPAFRQGLKEQGFVEGQNLVVEYRWAHGQYDRLPELAADLVHRQVAVLAAMGGQPSPHVAKATTQTIPIVFATNGDPVREALVASLNRPGGNATGVTIFGPAAVTKRLQLLHELVPKVAIIGFLTKHDAFEPHFARVGENGRAVAFQMLVEAQAKASFGQHTSKRRLADLKRITPHVVAIQFDQIEGVEEDTVVVVVVANEIERRHAVVIAGDSFAVDNARA